jgi:cytidine deaminase
VSGAVAQESLVPEDPEDLKLITLARAALARVGANQGACVRDTDGRAYAAASVHLEHLSLSAIAVAVAMAVSSGAGRIEAVALLGEPRPSAEDLEILRDLSGDDVTVWWADDHGTVLSMIEL